MRAVVFYQTQDGILHKSVQEAKSHLQKQYTETLESISHIIANKPRGMHMAEWVHNNLQQLVKLHKLAKEFKTSNSKEELKLPLWLRQRRLRQRNEASN